MATRIGARLPYRVFKDSGDVCTDATITFYLANTTTLQEVFSDKELTVTLGSTVSCNSVGVVPDIWVSDSISIKAIIAGTGVTSDTIDYLTVAASTVAGTTTGDFALGNAIVNGGLSAWTPGTSYSNISGSGTGVEVADDIYFVQNTAASNAISRQTANGTQARYCMRVGRPAGSTSTNKLRIHGVIPTDECYRLRGQEVTFSFRVKAGANFSGTALGVRIATGTTEAESGDLIEASGFAGNANPLNTTQAITTTATRYEFTCTLSATLKNLGWQLAYTGVGTAGAADYFEVEDLQIEIASAATSFKVVPEPLDFLRANLTTGARLINATPFTDPGADVVFGWDDSAGTFIGYTLGGALSTSTTTLQVTAASILTQLLTVDGAGSGLDADLLDGNSSAYYLAASSYTAADVLSKLLTVDGAASGLDADLLDGNSSAYFTGYADTAVANHAAAADPHTVYELESNNTAAAILTKILTVDGAGSGLDADLLDGKTTGTSGNTVPLLDGANTASGAWTFTVNPTISNTAPRWILNETDGSANNKIWFALAQGEDFYLGAWNDAMDTAGYFVYVTRTNSTIDAIDLRGTVLTKDGSTIWHAGNDGAGSGLDADLLDGVSSAGYYQVSGTDVALADGGTGASLTDPNADRIMFWDDSAGAVAWLSPGTASATGIEITTTNIALNAAGVLANLITVDGAASGLDADLLDGKNTGTSGNVVPLLDGANTWSGIQTHSADVILTSSGPGSVYSAGYKGAPRNVQNNAYTFVLADAGGYVTPSSSTTRAYTIPPNSDVAFPIGTVIMLGAFSGTITITRGAGVTLYDANGAAFADANITVTGGGTIIALATIIQHSANTWICSKTS